MYAGLHLSFALYPYKEDRNGEFPGFIWHCTYTILEEDPMNDMNDLTVEQVIACHEKVMTSEGGDDRLLSEAGLHQMVFSANRMENIFIRTAFTFFSLVAYPVYREGNNSTALLMAKMILSDNGYTLEANKDEMTALAQGIASFTLEQGDIEEWLHSHTKKASDRVSLL